MLQESSILPQATTKLIQWNPDYQPPLYSGHFLVDFFSRRTLITFQLPQTPLDNGQLINHRRMANHILIVKVDNKNWSISHVVGFCLVSVFFIVDCKTVVFFPYSEGTKRGSVILASARASHARRSCEAKKLLASLPSFPRSFYSRSRPFVRILPASLGYAKNATVLQSSFINIFDFVTGRLRNGHWHH